MYLKPWGALGTCDKKGEKPMYDYDNFFLAENDLNRAISFYTEILGLKVKYDFRDKGMFALKVGENEPAIILKDKVRFPDTKTTIWFVVDNVMATYSNLKSKGVKFITSPYQIFTGFAVEFDDPSGNRLGITDYTKSNLNTEKKQRTTDFVLRAIKLGDVVQFLQFQQTLDHETEFMMLYPEERSTDLSVLKNEIKQSIINGDGFFVAVDNSEIVGYVHAERGQFMKNKHSAYIVIGVLEKASGQGIGHKLLTKIDEWASNSNITRLELTVMANNKKAQNLYKKSGFKVEGIKEKSLKTLKGTYIDELYMAKIFPIKT